MKQIFFYLLLLNVIDVSGQQLGKDVSLIKEKALRSPGGEQAVKSSFFKGILKLYKRHISDQILNDCIYEQSCSEFSQGSIRTYGTIKGVFLSTDRLMRCNKLSQTGILPIRFNESGKISDHWHEYDKKD